MPPKLNSHQIRKSRVGESQKISSQVNRHPLVIVLDNVYDTYNIGSFFRLADAVAAQKIYLCGQVVTPPNIKIHRASIGTWKLVPWENIYQTVDCLSQLKKQGYQIVVCEQHPQSVTYLQAEYNFPLAIVAGSEAKGVSPEVLKIADKIVEIPLYGINVSLNVLVATAIIAYDAITKIK